VQPDPELLEDACSLSEAIRRLRYRQAFVHPGIPYGVLPTVPSMVATAERAPPRPQEVVTCGVGTSIIRYSNINPRPNPKSSLKGNVFQGVILHRAQKCLGYEGEGGCDTRLQDREGETSPGSTWHPALRFHCTRPL
jgi:hypothetical protein